MVTGTCYVAARPPKAALPNRREEIKMAYDRAQKEDKATSLATAGRCPVAVSGNFFQRPSSGCNLCGLAPARITQRSEQW
jgi:hypothetical protein